MGMKTEVSQLDLGASSIVIPNPNTTMPPSSHRYLCRILPIVRSAAHYRNKKIVVKSPAWPGA